MKKKTQKVKLKPGKKLFCFSSMNGSEIFRPKKYVHWVDFCGYDICSFEFIVKKNYDDTRKECTFLFAIQEKNVHFFLLLFL